MIPFDLVRSIIITNIPDGDTIEEVSAATGFSVPTIKSFFDNEVGYSWDEFVNADGIAAVTCSPYYDMVEPLPMCFKLAQCIADEINTFNQVPADTDIHVGSGGIVTINGTEINTFAWHCHGEGPNESLLYLAANGFYKDKGTNDMREIQILSVVRATNEFNAILLNKPQYTADELTIAGHLFDMIYMTRLHQF